MGPIQKVDWTNDRTDNAQSNSQGCPQAKRKEEPTCKQNRPAPLGQVPVEELLLRPAPHLMFIEPARYDRLIADLAARHAACARGRKAGRRDSRAGVSRKRTVFPGQHMVCGVCGRWMYWGGHGQAQHMMCAGAREYACWNGVTCDGRDAGRRIVAVLLATVESLPAFDVAFREKVEGGSPISAVGADRCTTQTGSGNPASGP